MSPAAGDRRPGLLAAACSTATLAALAAAACLTAAPVAQACELRLSEPRSDRELARLPLDRAAPEVRIAFEHSVLGTTVVDRYRFTPLALLVEEEFEGEGYGLPAAPGPGERLERIGPKGPTGQVASSSATGTAGPRQRLILQREVEPLVVRALPAQRMRLLQGDGTEVPLAALGVPAVRLQAVGCAPTPIASVARPAGSFAPVPPVAPAAPAAP